ncbi:MAG: hypothetical protein ACKVS6_15725 [Planctomycetota bacterium]
MPTLHTPGRSVSNDNIPEGYQSSGASPPEPATIHLLGIGKVGRAFLQLLSNQQLSNPVLLNNGFRLSAATDSTATVYCREGLAASEISKFKENGGSLKDYPGAERLPIDIALNVVRANIVIDAAPTNMKNASAALDRAFCALRAGSNIALAGKDALAAGAELLLTREHAGRVGINGALGETGAALIRELAILQKECNKIEIVANATTTCVIEAIENGSSLDDAIGEARRRGLLESDPGDDFNGSDAATKLAIVARAVFQKSVDFKSITREDLRDLDIQQLRARAAKGKTTRLVGRAGRNGSLSVVFQEVDRFSPLNVPSDRLVYIYYDSSGARRVFVGNGVGPVATARALWDDAAAFSAVRGGAR